MPYRKKTLRYMTPTQRKLARLRNEIHGLYRRLGYIIDEVGDFERLWRAEHTRRKIKAQEAKPCPEHGMVPDARCWGCYLFALEGSRLPLEGQVFDKLPEIGGGDGD